MIPTDNLILPNSINLAIDPSASRYQKIATVSVEFSIQDGEADTLEGRVPYKAGDAILTGIEGEIWPVAISVFESMYAPVEGAENIFRVKSNQFIFAKQLNQTLYVKIRNGAASLKGNVGDWLVQYSEGNYGVVADRVFVMTYREVD